jgi:hypothetical protein
MHSGIRGPGWVKQSLCSIDVSRGQRTPDSANTCQALAFSFAQNSGAKSRTVPPKADFGSPRGPCSKRFCACKRRGNGTTNHRGASPRSPYPFTACRHLQYTAHPFKRCPLSTSPRSRSGSGLSFHVARARTTARPRRNAHACNSRTPHVLSILSSLPSASQLSHSHFEAIAGGSTVSSL